MILRRVLEHMYAQNWTAIVLDFVIVVVGVVIGIQVSNWNDDRVARIKERAFILTIRDNIHQDIKDSQVFIEMLSDVLKYGREILETIDRDSNCRDNCWEELIKYFYASQWIDVRTNTAILDEIKRAGLPGDTDLKNKITRYYGLTDQYVIINSELPEYRELVRSIIPISVQEHMWAQCFRIDGRYQHLQDCSSPVSDKKAGEIFKSLRDSPETKSSLTYWLSTVSILIKALSEQISEAESVIATIEANTN